MSDFLSVRAVCEIARQEFVGVLTHPLILVAGLIVLIVSILEGAGGVRTLQLEQASGTGDALIIGFGQSFGPISMICTIMAIFLGATMIPYERWKNSLNVLLTKPLYRRDFILGKFVGLSMFMLLFNTFTILLVSLMLIIFFRGPQSNMDFTWRLIAYIVSLTLSCSLAISLNMLFGIVSKNVLFVTTASITYVFFDWIWYSDRILGTGLISLITPMNLYNKLINPLPGLSPGLFDTLPLQDWISAIIPFLALLLFEMTALLLVGIYVFSREDAK